MKSEAGPRVSVVTPVYNGEKHIATCIQSVLAQTYSNFEYLIINNCSTDGTLAIANEYARRDSRIRVISNPSLLNVVDSHNKAFAEAPPANKYIKILGADDWLFPNCLAEMVELAEAHPTIGMVTSYVLVGSRVSWDGLPFPSNFVKGRDICRMRLLDRLLVFGGPSASLLRTGAVKEQLPFYTVGNYHGDNDAYMRLLQRYDFGFVHQVLSYNHRGEDSRTTHYLESFNTYLPMVVEELVRFGPVFLTEPELKARLKEATDDYYRFLARAASEFRGKKFWEFHSSRLKTLGTPFDYARFTRFLFLRVLDILLNPKRMIEGIFRRLST